MKIEQTLFVIIFFLNTQHLFSQSPNSVSQKHLLVYSINEQHEKKIKDQASSGTEKERVLEIIEKLRQSGKQPEVEG